MSLSPNGKTLSDGILAFETSRGADRLREIMRVIIGVLSEHSEKGHLVRMGPDTVRVLDSYRIRHRELRRMARRLARAYLAKERAYDELHDSNQVVLAKNGRLLNEMLTLRAQVKTLQEGLKDAVDQRPVPPNPHASPRTRVMSWMAECSGTAPANPEAERAEQDARVARANADHLEALYRFKKEIRDHFTKGLRGSVLSTSGMTDTELAILTEAMR